MSLPNNSDFINSEIIIFMFYLMTIFFLNILLGNIFVSSFNMRNNNVFIIVNVFSVHSDKICVSF